MNGPPKNEDDQSSTSGKWLIIGIFAIAFGMGVYAWWHHWTQSRQVVAALGQVHANRIRRGQQVEFIDWTEGKTKKPERIDRLPGMIHVRHVLVEDYSYDWTTKEPSSADWQFSIRFTDDRQQTTTLSFDVASRVVRLDESGKMLLMTEAIERIAEVVNEIRSPQ